MVNSFIDKKDLDSKFSVVRNEYESGENSPVNALMNRMMEASFAWHNYGKSAIGERSDIENVNIERLQAFYKRYYQPDNAVSMIAGKFDEPKTLEMVKQYFGPITKPARELPRLYTSEPTHDGERMVTVLGDFDDKEIAKLANELFGGWKSSPPFARIPQVYHNVEPINKSFETPDKANAFLLAGMNLNLRDDDPDYPALVLGNYMLGGGFLNSRLAVRIRQKDGLSYGVGSSFNAGALDKTGSFMANAIYAPQNDAKLEAAFKGELARALKDGFTPDEVEKAKSGWLKSRQVSRAQDNELSGALVNGLYLNRTLAWDAGMEKKIEALTPDILADIFLSGIFLSACILFIKSLCKNTFPPRSYKRRFVKPTDRKRISGERYENTARSFTRHIFHQRYCRGSTEKRSATV